MCRRWMVVVVVGGVVVGAEMVQFLWSALSRLVQGGKEPSVISSIVCRSGRSWRRIAGTEDGGMCWWMCHEPGSGPGPSQGEVDDGSWGSLATEGAQHAHTRTHWDRHTEKNKKSEEKKTKKARPRHNADAM